MAVAGAPWQLEFEKVEQRCGYLLTSGQWSDCTFTVGSETNEEVIQAHKLVLAMASPVFEAMFYGGLSERDDLIVPIRDIQPESFRALLQYIYTGNIDIGSCDMALDLWYGAKKYMLPHLEKQCINHICSVVGPRNVLRAYEFACLFEEKTLVDKCIQIISTKTKEVLEDSSFLDVELKTLITVCSLDHLNVDSELDLFQAVARYAEAVQNSPPQERSDKILSSIQEKSQTRTTVGPGWKAPTEVTPSDSTISTPDKQNLNKVPEEPSIQAALQKLRFLSLTNEQFAKGPARSDLLTKEETLAVFMNIASRDSPVPMPTGFSECRERRQPRSDSQKNDQCFKPGSLEHTINALKCGDPAQVEDAARVTADMLWNEGRPLDIQPALDKGILEALVPALTEGSDRCKEDAVLAIYWLCRHGSPAQLRVLSESAALQPYCRLLTDTWGHTCDNVLCGLTDLLKKVEQNAKPDLLQKLRALDVPQLLIPLKHISWLGTSRLAEDLLRTYFSGGQ